MKESLGCSENPKDLNPLHSPFLFVRTFNITPIIDTSIEEILWCCIDRVLQYLHNNVFASCSLYALIYRVLVAQVLCKCGLHL